MSESCRLPTRRIGDLDAAKRKPISVKPEDRLEVAMKIMRSRDFSQLPVMSNDREVRGVITWKSIGEGTAPGSPCEFVHECMERPARVIGIDAPLLDATDEIADGYVLVRGKDGMLAGIVTASDFAIQFRRLAEPFLIIEEIELHLRKLVDGKFCPDELRGVVHGRRSRLASGPDDLGLEEFCRLLELSENWKRLGLDICRTPFLKQLKHVKGIRNKIMHFNPEGPDPEYLESLNAFAGRLRILTA